MPIVPQRASFTELITQAAEQRKSERLRAKEKIKLIKMESSRNITNNDPVQTLSSTRSQLALIMTDIQIFLGSKLWRAFHTLWFLVAVVTLTLACSSMSNITRDIVVVLDIMVDTVFIFEGILKLCCTVMLIIFKYEDNKNCLRIFLSMGVLEIAFSVCSLSVGRTILGTWFRLFRVVFIMSIALRSMEHIDVLISGISLGVASLLSTWLLLSVVFFTYASCAVTFFQRNDPYHFGSIAMSMWTFFEMSTLDEWESVLYINMYGCDKDINTYGGGTSEDDGPTSFDAYGGDMFLPICEHPEPRPRLASLVFVTFILICGFILVSLTLAAVTLGINERINEIKSENNKEDDRLRPTGPTLLQDLEDFNPADVVTKLKRLWHYQAGIMNPGNQIMSRLSSRRIHTENESHDSSKQKRLPAVLPPIDTDTLDGEGNSLVVEQAPRAPDKRASMMYMLSAQTSLDIEEFSLMDTLKMHVTDISNTRIYGIAVALLILFSAFLEIWVLQVRARGVYIDVIQGVIQLIFVMDIAFKFVLQHPSYWAFFDNNWNRFDFGVVLLTCIPFLGLLVGGGEYLGLLRVLRIIRILYLLTWITNLKIMMMSIIGSLQPLLYVAILMGIFFYIFSVAGVLMFQRNDYYHFGTVGRAFVTLFQVITLAGWSEVARTNMYGCDWLPVDDYVFDCDDPVALGWFAAWYFIVFILFGVMILVSLFVGIIITSMELLKEGIAAENEMQMKIKERQKYYSMDDYAVGNMLEIYETLDKNSTSVLTLVELRPVLELIANEADQIRIFMKADTNNSGQIDFSEFLDIVHMLGELYRRNTVEVNDNIKRVKLARAKAIEEGRSLREVLTEAGVRTKDKDNASMNESNVLDFAAHRGGGGSTKHPNKLGESEGKESDEDDEIYELTMHPNDEVISSQVSQFSLEAEDVVQQSPSRIAFANCTNETEKLNEADEKNGNGVQHMWLK